MLVIPVPIDTTTAAMPHAAVSTHSLLGLWWDTPRQTSLQQTGEPLDVASPVLRCHRPLSMSHPWIGCHERKKNLAMVTQEQPKRVRGGSAAPERAMGEVR